MRQTTLCYLKQNGRVLMLHRVKKEEDENAGKWIGIGGHFEEGESPEDCVCREFLEETGLTLTDYRYRGLVTFVSDTWGTEYMHLFTATAASGTLCDDCDEGELCWVEEDALASLPMWAGDAVFFDLLRTREEFFSLKLCYRGETLIRAVLNGKENLQIPQEPME